MQKIKVLQIITGLFPGGAERIALQLQSRLNPEEFDSNIAILNRDIRAIQVFGHNDINPLIFDLGGDEKIRNILSLRHHISRFKPDIIHAHMFHGLAASVLSIAFSSHRPALCFTSHLNGYTPLRQALVKLTRNYRNADIIFEDNQHSKMNAACTRIIPNGVEIPEKTPNRSEWNTQGEIKLLAVGRLTDQKDPIGLINSFQKLNLPNVRLDFAGEGPLESEARKAVISYGLSHQIRFLGLRDDVINLMQDYDILVMHSKYEGMPVTILEAGSQAMPVVSTSVGSIPTLLDGGCGMLCSREEFSITLAKAIANPRESLAAGSNLYKRVRDEHSVDGMTKAHETLYKELLSKKNKKTHTSKPPNNH